MSGRESRGPGQTPGDPAVEDEPSGGSIPPSDELEAALREATEAVEARETSRAPGAAAGVGGSSSADKLTIQALSDELQSLKSEYEDAKTALSEAEDRHLRLQAEFDNFRKRNLKERQEAHTYGHQNVVKDLLATVDNLERAIEHSEESDGGDLKGLLQGIELVKRELLSALGKHGVVQIEAMGQPFDPAYHEAMGQVERDDVPPNTVVAELQRGYQLRDRMLRPSRVMVSRGGNSPSSGPGSQDEEA